jgi:hypothetical protein
MNLTIEELVNRVVAEVLAELARRGIRLDIHPSGTTPGASPATLHTSVHVVDMSGFRSPVLLERHLVSLAPEIREISVPAGTVITPGARDLLRKKNLILKSKPTTN